MDKTFYSTDECLSEIKRLRLLLEQMIPNPEVIPPELAESHQWVVWSYEVRRQENGVYRVTKVPYPSINPNYEASSFRPSDWSDLDIALRCMKENLHIDGIGYVFADGDGLIGVDFDNCRDPITGAIQPEYQFWIEKLGSYAEISPSGTGVKVWIKGTVADIYFKYTESTGFRIQNFARGEIEIYRRGQYFTVTTQFLNGYDVIKFAQTELDVICEFSVSNTDSNFTYFPYTGDQLDTDKELSLVQAYWEEEKSFGYMYETQVQPNLTEKLSTETLSTDLQPQSIAKNYYSVDQQPRCRRCGKKCDPGNKLCIVCYRVGDPEEKVEETVYAYFSKFQGFFAARQHEINIGVYKPRPDVVMLNKKGNIVAITECKRGGIIDNGIEQLKSYLSASDTQFGVFANSTQPDNWIFYENLRGHRFEENIPRSRFETEIVVNRHIKSVREEKNELESEISHLCKQHERNVRDIEFSNKDLNELKDHIRNEREIHTKLKEDNDKLTTENTNLTIEIDKNTEDLNVQEYLKLTSKRYKLKSEVSSLSMKRDRLEKALEVAFSEHSIYGQLEKEFERLDELTSEIDCQQQLARENQQKYASIERKKVEINQKKQQFIQILQEREKILKQIRWVVNRLRLNTADPEEKLQLERHRKQLVIDLRNQKNNCTQLSTEIRQLQDVNCILELEINGKEHQSLFIEKDILPTYLQIEQEIDMLKAEKCELEAEIGHRVFELIPKKD